ncbi:MAG: Spy/CpxP family protein refolding chaperone [Acidobacteria bacterium]|nr:Spy/CpxP family protein refolding chaperone [Acidobacteriota bacterium]
MNIFTRISAAAGLLALSGLAISPLLAQDGPPPRPGMRRMGPGGPGGPGMGPGPMGLLGNLGRGMRELNLTEPQREQMRGIAQAHQAELKEVGDRLRAAHQGMEALVTADTVDEAAIRAKSAEVAAVQADAAVLRARVHQEVLSLLTAEQQAKVKELRAQAETRMKERAERIQERRQRPRPQQQQQER